MSLQNSFYSGIFGKHSVKMYFKAGRIWFLSFWNQLLQFCCIFSNAAFGAGYCNGSYFYHLSTALSNTVVTFLGSLSQKTNVYGPKIWTIKMCPRIPIGVTNKLIVIIKQRNVEVGLGFDGDRFSTIGWWN